MCIQTKVMVVGNIEPHPFSDHAVNLMAFLSRIGAHPGPVRNR
jgi:hypothetical protein